RASARCSVFFFQAEDGIRDFHVTGVQTCALPISSEQLLARALEDELRDARERVVIATKGGLRPVSGGVTRDSSPDFLRDGVDKSLDALGVDYIDLYQVHWPDPDTPLAETGAALAELRDEGKIRHIGVSNYSAEQMEELSQTVPVETLQ